MNTNNPYRIERKMEAMSNSKVSKWCSVNTDNEFMFMNLQFTIDKSVEEYKVHNKSGLVDEYTNESFMEEVLVVIDIENTLKFYNQDYESISRSLVTFKEL